VTSAANLLNLESVGKSYGTSLLLDGVSLGIAAGERIGIVGRNGDGKSTLVLVLAGVEPPDSGRVTHTGGLRIGLLAQHDTLDPAATVAATVVGRRAEHEWAGNARIREVLSGLLRDVSRDSLIGSLSGGERRRVALAALLVAEVDLLILDEPTNHLDVEGIDWLARQLAARSQALAVVTHDRWFLDAVCTRVWEVRAGGVEGYEGGYSAYVLARAERSRRSASTQARRQNLLRKELAWLRRGPPARTSKPRFRIDAANALIADEPPPRDRLALSRFATARLGKSVYDVEDVTLRLGERLLLASVTWRLGPGERVAVVGVNGSGKTSLLRLLSGELPATSGRVRVGPTVRVAYLSQEVTELPPTQRVLAAVEDVARVVDLGDGRSSTAAQLLERFGFTGPAQWTPVTELSGGERRRLQLLRLLMAGPNVLLLDEPTNDLDVETLTVLEDFLDGWVGTLVVVSHDRYFTERVTDTTVALLGNGQLAELPGGVADYLARRRAAAAPRVGSVGATSSRRAAGGDARMARKELVRLERRLERLARRESELHAALTAHATDYERVAEYDAELRALTAERSEAEVRWLAVAEGLEVRA
jgi:ABC transport system ATP-binding/permease protein